MGTCQDQLKKKYSHTPHPDVFSTDPRNPPRNLPGRPRSYRYYTATGLVTDRTYLVQAPFGWGCCIRWWHRNTSNSFIRFQIRFSDVFFFHGFSMGFPWVFHGFSMFSIGFCRFFGPQLPRWQVTVVTSAAESDRSTVMSVRACGAPSTPAAPVGAQEWNDHLM